MGLNAYNMDVLTREAKRSRTHSPKFLTVFLTIIECDAKNENFRLEGACSGVGAIEGSTSSDIKGPRFESHRQHLITEKQTKEKPNF